MKKLNITLFLLMLISFAGMITLFPKDERTVDIENRNLNSFPSLTVENMFGGEFGNQFESWVSDRVGWRADFVAASRTLVSLTGVAPSAQETESVAAVTTTPAATAAGPTGNPSEADAVSANNPAETAAVPTRAPAPKVIIPEGGGQVLGSLLTFDDRLCELFYAAPETAARYADAINAYRAALGDDVRVFSLLAPTQIEFMPEKYKEICDSQAEAISAVYDSLTPGAIGVDAYSAIAAHLDEYLYFRTDHHWTALGSYYAYTAFAEAAGFESIPLSAYEETEFPNFLGYLYNMAPTDRLRDNPDVIHAYRYKGALETSQKLLYPPDADQKTAYSVFLGGDKEYMDITTSVKNGKTAVIIKDSYANCFTPWLAPHYERLILLDPRYFQGSVLETVQALGDADLIFVNYTLTTTFTDFVESIHHIM
jgi:hypothetical protein